MIATETPAFTIFLLLKTTPAWRALPRAERDQKAQAIFGAALPAAGIRVRLFDAEAFSGRCTDIAMFETDDLTAYYFVIERLRDSVFFTVPYFEVVAVVPTIENGFRRFAAADLGEAA